MLLRPKVAVCRVRGVLSHFYQRGAMAAVPWQKMSMTNVSILCWGDPRFPISTLLTLGQKNTLSILADSVCWVNYRKSALRHTQPILLWFFSLLFPLLLQRVRVLVHPRHLLHIHDRSRYPAKFVLTRKSEDNVG